MPVSSHFLRRCCCCYILVCNFIAVPMTLRSRLLRMRLLNQPTDHNATNTRAHKPTHTCVQVYEYVWRMYKATLGAELWAR